VFTASCILRPGVLEHPKDIYGGWSSYNNDRDMAKGKRRIHGELSIQSRIKLLTEIIYGEEIESDRAGNQNPKRMAIRSDER